MPLHEDNVEIEITVRTKKTGSECRVSFDYPRDEWEALTPEEQHKYVWETLLDSDLIDWGYEVKNQ